MICDGIRTYAWTSARSHAHHLIHYATASHKLITLLWKQCGNLLTCTIDC
ncbi:hypothetical protein E2C01_070336 [Portunus trituberculatus]|uniref:Uncharacterized protein n=1 Tax=Portunus trituberculatus TaxID=210409 RepID=A0A5B7I1U2_PORTR|nr:hypothetical protein [Portunus trituberculatus]